MDEQDEYQGRIENALLFNRALSAAEIKALVDGDINVLGFVTVHVQNDAPRVPHKPDREPA